MRVFVLRVNQTYKKNFRRFFITGQPRRCCYLINGLTGSGSMLCAFFWQSRLTWISSLREKSIECDWLMLFEKISSFASSFRKIDSKTSRRLWAGCDVIGGLLARKKELKLELKPHRCVFWHFFSPHLSSIVLRAVNLSSRRKSLKIKSMEEYKNKV